MRFAESLSTIGAKIIILHNGIVSNYFPDYVICFLHFRIGFELFPQLCNLLHCYKAYHVGIGLHYINVSNEFTGYVIYFYIAEPCYPKGP